MNLHKPVGTGAGDLAWRRSQRVASEDLPVLAWLPRPRSRLARHSCRARKRGQIGLAKLLFAATDYGHKAAL